MSCLFLYYFRKRNLLLLMTPLWTFFTIFLMIVALLTHAFMNGFTTVGKIVLLLLLFNLTFYEYWVYDEVKKSIFYKSFYGFKRKMFSLKWNDIAYISLNSPTSIPISTSHKWYQLKPTQLYQLSLVGHNGEQWLIDTQRQVNVRVLEKQGTKIAEYLAVKFLFE